MSCSDINKNIDAKHATYWSLSNLYKYTKIPIFEPNTELNPFKSDYTDDNILVNINKNLDDLDNVDTNLKNLFIKDNISGNIYQNCVIQSNNPWFTSSSDYKKCEVIDNIKLDNKLKFNADKTIINLDLKSKNKSKTAYASYYSNVNKAYCENRWYDWIITPNYYLGNTYLKDNSKFGENDVYKCYKPCTGSSIPYKTEKGENKCIPKKYFGNGIFANKLMFSPIGLINLIGNVAIMNDTANLKIEKYNLLFKLYKSILDYNITNKVDDEIYITNDVYENITLINLKNDFDDIYKEFKTCIDDNILHNFNNNDNQEYNYINDLTYKHRHFNENEPEMYTLKGLDVCGALIPPILHHTWVLANIFKPLSDDYIEKYDTNIKKIILYDKLKTVFNDNNNKAIRLTNIFFKAVNICYNNKSNFSINIIDKTKKSFETSYIDNYTNLLEAYTSYDNIENIYNSDNPIFNNEYKLYTEEDLYNVKKSFLDIVDNTVDIPIRTKKFKENTKLGELHGYFYAVEKLEAKICDKGMIFNSKIGECVEIPDKDTDKDTDTDTDNKDNKIDDIEFDNSFNEIKDILNMFLQIILVIIILYIIYIFYDIFGEIIFTVFNYLYMKSYELSSNTFFYISSIFIEDDEKYEKQKVDTDYKLANKEYENLQNNHLKILSYMNENKIPINPDS